MSNAASPEHILTHESIQVTAASLSPASSTSPSSSLPNSPSRFHTSRSQCPRDTSHQRRSTDHQQRISSFFLSTIHQRAAGQLMINPPYEERLENNSEVHSLHCLRTIQPLLHRCGVLFLSSFLSGKLRNDSRSAVC